MKTKEITNQNGQEISSDIIKSLVLDGDISKMNPLQKVEYYNHFCHSLGLNPLTQPFQIIKFQGKERLYACKDCTEQLRKLHGVGITEISTQEIKGVFVVTAKAVDKTGKTDVATGAVSIGNTTGDALANLLMKAETKAKRRVTLSICGLGMLDESELDTMPKHEIQPIHTASAEKSALPKTEIKQKTENKVSEKEIEFIFNVIDDINGCGTREALIKIWKNLPETQQKNNNLIVEFKRREKEIETEKEFNKI